MSGWLGGLLDVTVVCFVILWSSFLDSKKSNE